MTVMKNKSWGKTWNQLIIAVIFALLLGVIIVAATRCNAGGTPSTTSGTPSAVKTPAKTGTPGPTRATGAATTVPAKTTEVVILPPGGLQPSPSPTPIMVGPLPGITPQPQTTPGTTPAGSTGAGTAVASSPSVAPPPTATRIPSAGGTTYIVKRGDTLSAIARMYGTTVTAIAQANGITNPSRIYTGQKLIIPAGGSVSSSGGTASGSKVYIVQRGDSLARIAARYGTTVDAIVRANNLRNPNLIYAGQKLIIP